MKNFILFFLTLSMYSTYAQQIVVELPKFPSYFTKTTDTLNYYKNGGTLNGNVREVTKYLKSYRATSKHFNLKKEPVTDFGKRLYKIKIKNDSVKEVYFLDTNPTAGDSYRKRDENNYYLGQIITYDAKKRIRSLKKINNDLSEELIEYAYNSNNQLISITEKAFLTAEIASDDGTEIQEIYITADPTYIRTTKAIYNTGGRLEKLMSIEEDEYNENTIHATKTFNYYSGTKVREVVLETYQIHKETNKKLEESTYKFIKLFYNPDNTLKETILNYKNKQEGNVTVKANYRQIPSLPFEIIKVTTSAELNDKMDILTENFEIKRDEKQNIIEVTNATNQDWKERITFKYKYY